MKTAYQFMLANAGFSYSPDERPIDGRRRCASALAKAEKWAKAQGFRYQWERDADEAGMWECVMFDAEFGDVLQSLCGIDFASGEPWGEDYKRVVEAELALQQEGTSHVG